MKLPAMRLVAIPPALCAVVGFTLAMLCIFAGSKPGYLEDTDLLTLNTSMIGVQVFSSAAHSSASSGNGGGGLLSSILSDGGKLENTIASDIENEINSGIHDIASHLNISDFYSWHLLDFCQGFYEPGANINATNPSPWKNVTACSKRTGFYSLNATAMLQAGMLSGVNLSTLQWPTGLETAIDTVEGAAHAMFVLYCMGAAAAGVAMFTGIATVLRGCATSPLGGMINAGLHMVAFVALGLASAIVTSVIDKVKSAVDEVASEIGIEAIKGSKFITLTWVTTLLMALGAVGWTADFFLAKRQRVRQKTAEVEKLEEQ